MKKRLALGFLIVFLFTMLDGGAYAQQRHSGGGGGHGGGSGGKPPVVPEPMSYLIFSVSGATYIGIRYLRARKNAKKLHSQSKNTAEEV
ncbi:MAG: hypothetical protein DCC43_13415 [Candidatus Brocadia sp.]|uniref:PEP-CTERM protein-sorting domain-containing protein n=1 Tax=Candidatus Brocadia fulgida TaxID=380242 RepID=A0A0M2USS8_9BACT|nr:MAG: hypothetical protein BROFUL_02381 [Candidatus Brocadia fulgida]MCC6325672.1 hypothetical protein [Candidatus Brocadia sp.]MCE7912534.1 hypothetical protein [Candidatus Brocadia sp. AMX3]OQY97773.1 MAG: hypothetical protein B6D35_14155 [Candidatus Brocadia sp. UTAMX2]MBV6517468.1 hypothetical protein [Candidatus Brocadia fulgida]